ncbi:MAG: glycosyltransferase family 9 protein [bacterium]|nr:glycosyltransferase family 9 protein [bacterium]
MKEGIERILVIRSGAIGDFIITLPVIQLLRRAFPGGWLSLVAKSRVRPLVQGVVDEFVDIDGTLLLPFFGERPDPVCEEFRYLNTFDLIISYLGSGGIISANLLSLPHPRVVNADVIPPPDYSRHITEYLLEPLSQLIDTSSPPFPSITIPTDAKEWARGFLRASGVSSSGPLIAVHPGSGSRDKIVAPATFCRAVRQLQRRLPGAHVLVVEGEADEECVSVFLRELGAPHLNVKNRNLVEVASLLSHASLFLGNDSGIAHLAAAVGVPTIAVFRASNPKVWAPRGAHVWVATKDSLPQVIEELPPRLISPRSGADA